MIQAMILAAGRGERMRPLTDTTPKPLLQVGGKPLIVWHIERLAATGISDIVINHAWLGSQIESVLGDGSQWDVNIVYSPEKEGGLETAGGIRHALPLLGETPFLVINGDIWCDWSPMQAMQAVNAIESGIAQAWLLLVDNPSHHPEGDFILLQHGRVIPKSIQAIKSLTFAGIGVYSPTIFKDLTDGDRIKLAPVLHQLMLRQQVLGTHYQGQWVDVGTPQRLTELDQHLQTISTSPTLNRN